MCHQSVGLIQSIIEKAGIPTVSVTMLREITERVGPPRALSVDFPLGYPLGMPNDAASDAGDLGCARHAARKRTRSGHSRISRRLMSRLCGLLASRHILVVGPRYKDGNFYAAISKLQPHLERHHPRRTVSAQAHAQQSSGRSRRRCQCSKTSLGRPITRNPRIHI